MTTKAASIAGASAKIWTEHLPNTNPDQSPQ
jgi:hypothetical protein